MAKVLLITGATGQQGGAVIDALLSQKDRQFTILAVTRNAQTPKAKQLASKSPTTIKLVEGDLDDVPALFKAADKVLLQQLQESTSSSTTDNQKKPARIWGVFSVQVSVGRGVTTEGEILQGKALIDGALEAGVRHFVYAGVERGGDARSWDNPTPVPHFQSKYHIERHLRDSSAVAGKEPPEMMGWTILRPVAFMENLAPGFPTTVFLTAVRDALREHGTMQWVSTRDVGVFAAMAFTDPEAWSGRAVGIAGDELSFHQLNNAFQRATGNPAPTTYWFFGAALMYMLTEVRLMVNWFKTEGYKSNIRERKKEHPDLFTMEEWLVQRSGFKKA